MSSRKRAFTRAPAPRQRCADSIGRRSRPFNWQSCPTPEGKFLAPFAAYGAPACGPERREFIMLQLSSSRGRTRTNLSQTSAMRRCLPACSISSNLQARRAGPIDRQMDCRKWACCFASAAGSPPAHNGSSVKTASGAWPRKNRHTLPSMSRPDSGPTISMVATVTSSICGISGTASGAANGPGAQITVCVLCPPPADFGRPLAGRR